MAKAQKKIVGEDEEGVTRPNTDSEPDEEEEEEEVAEEEEEEEVEEEEEGEVEEEEEGDEEEAAESDRGSNPKVPRGGLDGKKRIKMATRCQLNFPPTLMKRRLTSDRHTMKVSTQAAIFLAAGVEALVFEVLQATVESAKTAKKKSLTAQHLLNAIRGDEELSILFRHAVIAQAGVGGVRPSEHA